MSIVSQITPVILCGGSGSRLWPLSRQSFPKQFSKIFNEKSLFQSALLRFTGSEILNFTNPLIVTNSDFRFTVGQQMKEIDINAEAIILEPSPKNTAPAILSACISASASSDDPLILVSPSDHVISDHERFQIAIMKGLKSAEKGSIVTFGIKPIRPETGYGYIEYVPKPNTEIFEILSFLEKPPLKTAEEIFKKDNYVWNSGIFLFKASSVIKLFQKLVPNIYNCVKSSITAGKIDLDFFRLDESAWTRCPDISFDRAIMENVSDSSVVPYGGVWSDLGGWDAVWTYMEPNEDGVACSKNAFAIESKNSLLRSENEDQILVGLGLDNIVAIAMPDAVLVSNKENCEEIKQIVPLLKANKISQAELFTKFHRPWGWYESLTISDHFQVKRILVNQGASLSLQSHHHRSEHWIVVEGTALVSIDGSENLLHEGQSVYIPLGAKHRLSNPGKLPLIIIEVQTGSYFGEDDIVRYDDIYGRIS